MKMRWKKITLALMVAFTFCVSLSALANEIESRKLAIIQVEGKEAEIKKPNGRIVKAASGMSLGVDNRVTSGKGTYVYISADDDKTFKMDEKTTIQITKASEKSLSVDILDGQLFFNVEKPLKSDEEMSFRVANTSMSIRGTSGWLRYDTMDMEFFLAEGTVNWDIDGQEITVNPGQRVLLERDWGGENPGPGRPLKYTISIQDDYTWEELPKDALVAFMEHRAQIDLTAIGLDTPEEIVQAAEEVEEIEKEREEANKPVYIEPDDDDDDWYPPVTQPPTTATPSNAESTEEPSQVSTEVPTMEPDRPHSGDLWNIAGNCYEEVSYSEGDNPNGSWVYNDANGNWEWEWDSEWLERNGYLLAAP